MCMWRYSTLYLRSVRKIMSRWNMCDIHNSSIDIHTWCIERETERDRESVCVWESVCERERVREGGREGERGREKQRERETSVSIQRVSVTSFEVTFLHTSVHVYHTLRLSKMLIYVREGTPLLTWDLCARQCHDGTFVIIFKVVVSTSSSKLRKMWGILTLLEFGH